MILNAAAAVHRFAAGQADVQLDASVCRDIRPARGQLVKRTGLVQESEINLGQNVIEIALLTAPSLHIDVVAVFEIAQVSGRRNTEQQTAVHRFNGSIQCGNKFIDVCLTERGKIGFPAVEESDAVKILTLCGIKVIVDVQSVEVIIVEQFFGTVDDQTARSRI